MKNMVTLMQLLVVLVLGLAAARPAKYDQRQDGDLNVHAHLENIVVVYIKGSSLGVNLLDLVSKKKAVAKLHDALGKDAGATSQRSGGSGASVLISGSPDGGVDLQFKTDEESAPAGEATTTEQPQAAEQETLPDNPPTKVPSGTSSAPVAVEPPKNTAGNSLASTSDKKPAEETPLKDSPSSEESKEKSSEEDISQKKSSEENSSDGKSSEEKDSKEKSSEESSSSKESGEKEESKKKPKGARELARGDEKGVAKLKMILEDGVEPCLQVSSQGLCQPIARTTRQRMERQQRQRLIDILSSGLSPATY